MNRRGSLEVQRQSRIPPVILAYRHSPTRKQESFVTIFISEPYNYIQQIRSLSAKNID